MKRSMFADKRRNQRRGVNENQNKRNGLSRKQNRKQARKSKKEKKNQMYLARFKRSSVDSEIVEERKSAVKHGKLERIHSDTDSSPTEPKKSLAQEKGTLKKKPAKQSSQSVGNKLNMKQKSTMEKDREVIHKEPYEDAVMMREQRQLQQLEKQLNMKKRKNLPKAFLDDGLDFLLDVVDPSKKQTLAMEEASHHKKSKTVEKSGSPSKVKTSRKVHFADEMEDESAMEEDTDEDMELESASEEEGSQNEDMFEDSGDEEERFLGGESDEDADSDMDDMDEHEEEDEEDDITSDTEKDNSKVREDIYGRLVDNKGNVLSHKGDQGGTYVPPAKRAAMLAASGKAAIELERLKKQMKGLLNRASESNMQSIANAVEELYMHHSRASVSESLFTLIREAVVAKTLTPERLVAEMAMLVAILHGNVGSEVGAYFLQHTSKLYDELRQQDHYGEEHTIDNVLLLLCYLYNFKVAHHVLLFDIMTLHVESFSEKDIEILLLILRTAGFYLRRDDPESLGNQIIAIQQKARVLEDHGKQVPARCRFMLEVLVAVRNNNVRRVPGADVERTDRLRQLAGKFVRGGSLADNQLNIGMGDLLQADEKGRWWIVGSAWEGRAESDASSSKDVARASTATVEGGAVSQKLEKLAKKLRISSDLRRSIFYVLMSSEDYEDAFQKLLQLGLKGQQEREIVVISVFCCKQESQYNPFYSYLLQKLAAYDRRFMIAIRFHMWDTFKTLDELSSTSRNNLAMMLAHLLAAKSLSLSVLKVLEFGILTKATTKFLKCALINLLTSVSMSDLKEIFSAVCLLAKFRELVDGLKAFFIQYVKVDGAEKKKLVEVCNILSQNHQIRM